MWSAMWTACPRLQVDPEAVVAAISSLPVPTEWVDPVTQASHRLEWRKNGSSIMMHWPRTAPLLAIAWLHAQCSPFVPNADVAVAYLHALPGGAQAHSRGATQAGGGGHSAGRH